jgi:hypothetical protein
MAVKMKPVGASEIKDPKIVREAIAQVRKERTPELVRPFIVTKTLPE